MSLLPAQQSAVEQRIVKLSAGLDGDQLLWASGYLAGLAAARTGVHPDQAAAPQESIDRPSITLWYGTETGNSRGIAERLAEHVQSRGWPVNLASLDAVPPRSLAKQSLLVLVVSTHGDGEPPEAAEAFHSWLHADRAPRLEELRYAVLALGDSSYPAFCQTGKEVDARLEALGAKRLLDRHDVDVDFEEAEAAWADRLIEALKPLMQETPAAASNVVALTTPAPRIDRSQPFEAELIERAPLTVTPSNKQVSHVVLSLEGSGLQWQPGDSLGVWPTNAPSLVEQIMEATGLLPETPIQRSGREWALVDWLGSQAELTRLARPFIQAWAELSDSTELANLLACNQQLAAWQAQRQVLDVVKGFPVRVDGQTLVDSLRRVSPRLYSIASSPLVADDEIALTVKLEQSQTALGQRTGVASGQLVERLAVGERLPIYVEANPRFRLPEDGDRPIIMIGPGTGVAPFRAFVEHRQAQGAGGPAWLFFGEQHRRTDFLYQLEWQRHLAAGSLSRLSVAFSRDQAQRVYVQQRLREQGRAVYDWLEQGAHLYVCGNGSGMARDVHQALIELIAEHGGLDQAGAQDYLDGMKADHRYQKDVY